MPEPIKNKRYFVKDESLHNVDGDMFNYADISKVLDDIITTNSPPYNVAIIGKWGLGKSSLINLAVERYKKEPDRYLIQEINAWKYEKDSLRRVFLKQLWQGISNQKVHSFEVIRREFSRIVNANITNFSVPKDKQRTKQIAIIGVVITILTIVAFLFYKCIQAIMANSSIFTWNFLGAAFLSYCRNIGTILFIPVIVALFKLLIDDYHEKNTQKIELNFPIETTDDYEIFLETKIKEKLEKQHDLRIITVYPDHPPPG